MMPTDGGVACILRAAKAGGSRRGAFTLIELLVVMAVIGLLISIMTPAISAARRVSQRSVCGTNLHALGQAVQAYLNANKDVFPFVANWPPKEREEAEKAKRPEKPAIYRAFQREISAEGKALERHELFKCPSDRRVDEDPALTKNTYYEEAGTSYEWNAFFDGQKIGFDFLTRKKAMNGLGWTLAQTPMIYDFKPFHHKDPKRVGSVMYLFADFHVAPDTVELKKG